MGGISKPVKEEVEVHKGGERIRKMIEGERSL